MQACTLQVVVCALNVLVSAQGIQESMIVFAFVLRFLYELASLSRSYFDVGSVKAFDFISD